MPQLLSEQFLQLDLVLAQYQQYWRFSPFHLTALPWADTRLGEHLRQLTPAEIERLDQDEVHRRSSFSEFFPEVSQSSPFELATASSETSTSVELPFWFSRDIKGRKLEQIQAFATEMQQSDLPVLEWCAGKGHLGRVLAQQFQDVFPELHLQLGIMVEVPSAALLAPQLAREVDFFSIGTNDLTQYTLAIDRGHPSLSAQADGLHPAVLSLIDMTVRAAHAEGKWVGVCGELAADPQAVAVLLGLDVDELSVAARSIAEVKALVRQADHQTARALAREALQQDSAAAVRALVERY